MPRHAGTWKGTMRGASHPGPENTSSLATECCRCGEKRAERKRRTKGHEDRVTNVTETLTAAPTASSWNDGAEIRDILRLAWAFWQVHYGVYIIFITPAPPPLVFSSLLHKTRHSNCSHDFILFISYVFCEQICILVLPTSVQFWIVTDENVLTAARPLLQFG